MLQFYINFIYRIKMADTTSLQKGVTIKRDNKLWFVSDVFFVSPGKGTAFFRTKLKEVGTGKVVDNTFKSGESIELVETERKSASFLYKDGDFFVFMDDENYEQYYLEESQLEPNIPKFIKEEVKVIIFFAEGTPVMTNFHKTKLPLKVVDAPPGLKGDTATNTTRMVTLETGAEIQAPLFIKEGEMIIVNVEKEEYCERYKE